MQIDELTTPCAVIDRKRLEANISRFESKSTILGVRLRPHVKTHKTVEIAQLQTQSASSGITVSTLAEARTFARAGFRDILYAVPLAPQKIREALDLAHQLERFGVLSDDPQIIGMIDDVACEPGLGLSVHVEIDCGGRRSGVDPGTSRFDEVVRRILNSKACTLAGILTHAGHAYECQDWPSVEAVARQEVEIVAAAAAHLRRQGIEVGCVSIGSTPTFVAVEDVDGIDEVRPGNYVFFDAFQAALGSCSLDEVAFSVLSTVLGVYGERQEMVIDAGALALSKDPGPITINPNCGYGRVCQADGISPLPDLSIVALTQEHGVVRSRSSSDLEGWRPGMRLRIIPNHSCLAAALYDRYMVLDRTRVVDEWRPVRGW